MGVKGLWDILNPASEKCPIGILSKQVVAIDASLWIMHGNKSPAGLNAFIKIIFYRVRSLLRLGACPVFVFEGVAPTLKYSCLQERTDYSSATYPVGQRTYLQEKAKECQLLLNSLGVPYLQSRGEGEALCALLNTKGIVDGCITEDVDFFLFGGKRLYRFFSTNPKDDFIYVYNSSVIERRLKLDQKAMIATALILGCDFLPKGVPGVGKVKLKRLLRRLSGQDILEKFNEWRREQIQDGSKANETEDEKVSSLKKSPKRKSIEFEVKTKAVSDPTFPNKKVIDEYLAYTDDTPEYPIVWTKPNFESFQETMCILLKWNKSKCRENFLPILTAWVFQHPTDEIKPLHLERIVKHRNLRGVPYLEVLWNSEEYYLQGTLKTLERESDVKLICPDLAEEK